MVEVATVYSVDVLRMRTFLHYILYTSERQEGEREIEGGMGGGGGGGGGSGERKKEGGGRKREERGH